jgi:RNA polymerase II subunit A small phosphatase-like protein
MTQTNTGNNANNEKKTPVIGSPDGRNDSKPKGFVPPTPPPPLTKWLLPPMPAEEKHKKCLVLDLDETLVHSSFKPIPNPDFVISIELENVIHKVYVRKRPGVDNFLRVVGEKFEVVVFTASLAKYADPLLDILDKSKVVRVRLFREACVLHYGNYVKDLTHLGRALEHTTIIDNSPFSYMFQPDNAIPITSWFNDRNDRQLYDLIPFLDTLAQCDDVVAVLQRHKMTFNTV